MMKKTKEEKSVDSKIVEITKVKGTIFFFHFHVWYFLGAEVLLIKKSKLAKAVTTLC